MSVELSDIAVKDILEKVNEALAPSNSEAEAEGEQTEDPIEAVRVSSVLETILDQIGIEGKLPSGSPYVSINKDLWAKISTVNGKQWIKVLKIKTGDGFRFTEKDGQSFLEKEPAPKPTPRMESTSLGTSKIYTRIPSPEDNINELRHMVYGNLRALMRDDEFFLHDIEKVLGIKSTLNALHWFSSHTKKPNLFQKLVLKLTGKYWSF